MPADEIDDFSKQITARLRLMSSLKLQFAAAALNSGQSTPKTPKDIKKQQSEMTTQLNIVVEVPVVKQSRVKLLNKARLMNSGGIRLARANVKLEVPKETHRYMPITKDEAQKLVEQVTERVQTNIEADGDA